MKSERKSPSRREEGSALPVWKAFVVQFSRATENGTEAFSGRVEHLSSGRRTSFDSKDELLTVLLRMLDELGETNP